MNANPLAAERNAWRRFRNRVVTGVFIVVPTVVTIWLAMFIFSWLTEWAIAILQSVPDAIYRPGIISQSQYDVMTTIVNSWPVIQLTRLLSLALLLALLFGVGEMARHATGQRMIRFFEWVLLKVPLLSSVYITTRQIGDALWTSKGGMFRKAVLFEYPRRGLWVIGFLTNDNSGGGNNEIIDKSGRELLNIFLPTTPNPTSGFLIFVPKDDCVMLDLDIAQAMRLIISGGALTPDINAPVGADGHPIPIFYQASGDDGNDAGAEDE